MSSNISATGSGGYSHEYSEESSVEVKTNLQLTPASLSCDSSCLRRSKKKPIHVSEKTISMFTKAFEKEGETKEISSKKFKINLLDICNKDMGKYKLLCMASKIDPRFDHGIVTMGHVEKVKRVYLQVFGKEIFPLIE